MIQHDEAIGVLPVVEAKRVNAALKAVVHDGSFVGAAFISQVVIVAGL
jgi:hypothetical protein